MNSPADRAKPNASTLQAALLDYSGAPGKYQLSLRQPALLFASIRQVLQLAAGRSAGGEEQPENKALMEAAAFFIRAALLYPGATHYAVMGLPAKVEPIELKERYRLLMRLIHPDFAAAHAQTWPGDAAVRVNRAYEVLSSPVLRAEYDEQLAAAAPQRPAVKPKMDLPLREAREESAWRFNRAAVWVLVASGCVVVVASLIPWQGPDQLVQKSDAPAPVAVERPQYQPPVRAQAVAIANVPSQAPMVPAPVAPAPAPVPAPMPAARPAPMPAAASVPAPVKVPTPASVPAPAPASAHAAAPAPAPAPAHAAAPAHVPVAAAAARVAPVAPRAEPPMQLRASASLPAIKPQPMAPARDNAPPPVVVAAAQAPRPSPFFREPETPRPPERRAEPSLPPPVVQLIPVPVAVVREEAPRPAPIPLAAPLRAEPVPRASGTEPSLNDAQPLLTQLLQSMEGGSGEQILRLLESDARRTPAAVALSRRYDQLVGQARPVRLSHVEFRSESREGVLLVTGKVRLHAGDPTIGAYGEGMSLRAEFVSRGGKVLLTALSGAPD